MILLIAIFVGLAFGLTDKFGCNDIGDTLYVGEQLNPGDCLVSYNEEYAAVLQGDGNFVLYEYDNGDMLANWATGTNSAVVIAMQGDGNLVAYDANGGAPWAHMIGSDDPNLYLIMQTDGNLVEYAYGSMLWNTGTFEYIDVCWPGTYMFDDGLCVDCTAGSYCPAGATIPTECPNGGGSVTGATSEMDCFIYDAEFDCYSYEGEYIPGFAQCGYDDEHFKTTDENLGDLTDINDILEGMETDFENEGEAEKQKVRDAFDDKKNTYDFAVQSQTDYETAMNQRIVKEGEFDAAREVEELAHQALLDAVDDYNFAVSEYGIVHAAHVIQIDFLNYELFIIHQIRELLGPQLGDIVQSVVEYEPYDDLWEGFELNYPTIEVAAFDHGAQRFGGTKKRRRKNKKRTQKKKKKRTQKKRKRTQKKKRRRRRK